MSAIGETLEARYEVQDCGYETPCWVWRRFLHRSGYGQMWSPVYKRVVRAHRHYYEHFVGPIPAGHQIDHLCRVTACVNPAHLEPVTQEVNQRRGRACKLSDEQVAEIRAASERTGLVAARFGVSVSHVWNLRAGRYRT